MTELTERERNVRFAERFFDWRRAGDKFAIPDAYQVWHAGGSEWSPDLNRTVYAAPSFHIDEAAAFRLACRINMREVTAGRFLLRLIFRRQLEVFDFAQDKHCEFFPCMDGDHARAICEAASYVLKGLDDA